jgi:hypothetical protein
VSARKRLGWIIEIDGKPQIVDATDAPVAVRHLDDRSFAERMREKRGTELPPETRRCPDCKAVLWDHERDLCEDCGRML